jgi:hypothetical protein
MRISELNTSAVALTSETKVWFKLRKFFSEQARRYHRSSNIQGGVGMNSLVKYASWLISISLVGALAIACSSVEDKPAPKPAAPGAPSKPEPAPAPAPAKTDAAKTTKTKAVEVEGVISAVGQRTITFQMERKGKVREEVVGVDDKTKIEKGGANVKLRDLQETDKAMINYEPEAYTPAIAIKVTGKGEIKKVGGDD